MDLPAPSERKKCLATGKICFASKMEARLTILRLRWGFKALHNRLDGRRIKHRQGRPQQRRAYYCPHCGGYHLTKWGERDFKRYESREDLR
ncbi:hypothetical protein SAMN05421740_101334 [Parapedobacter koreensis]|uniref:Uncharacterized protein n=1 Tax=Parapedobacter koreensis TaxID=332977 RepID=A0A1H7FEZ4_9SPHI|nr:hypothetical protein SAMN05421740_101334 [Parapedobacter koreensis]